VFLGATDVTATLGTELELPPGGRAEVELALDRAIALEPGVRFAVREGGRTIGAGVVTATQ
jgi:elongation factor Tu